MSITKEKTITTTDLHIEGFRIRVAIRKGDRDKAVPLFLFNGLGANWEIVLSAFQAYDENTEIIAFDIPGTGSSSVPILPYSFQQMSYIAQQILVQSGYKEVHVLGISWGGGLAQQFAYMYPEHCKKLILVATSPGVLMIPGKPTVLLKMLTPLRYWSPKYMMRIAGDIYGGAFRFDKALGKNLTKRIRPNNIWGYFLQMSAISRFTSLPWLKKIQQPTLVMTGDDDPIVPVVNSKILASLIPNATLSVIEGGGHLFLLTQPKLALSKIETFLNE